MDSPAAGGGVTSATETERVRIMQAAYELLSRDHGNLTVNDILEAAGLSTRAYYRHFASKDDLVLALHRRDADRLTERLQAAAAAAGSPRQALMAWIHGMLNVTTQPRLRARAVVLGSEQAQHARGLAAAQREFRARQNAAVAAILADGRASGEFGQADPEPDARQICAAVREAFADQMSRQASISAEQAAEQIATFALRALGADRPERPPLA
ncbi:MAG: regulatory protein TetR [Frankiales bacterium]|nr:regulatory protein TetR [Frankiales bacterium]